MSRFTDLYSKTLAMNSQYKIAVERNKAYDSLIETKNDLSSKITMADNYITLLRDLEASTKNLYKEFQASRIGFIEENLKTNIDYLFYNRGFVPKIEYEVKRRKVKSKLILKDKDGNLRYPDITEGDFLKQLIGYTSAMSILKMVGSKVFYIDEAFSNASNKNKERMQAILYEYTYKQGLQTILISQSSEVYEDLPRKEFRLLMEPSGRFTELVSTEEFELNPSKLHLILPDADDKEDSFEDIIKDLEED